MYTTEYSRGVLKTNWLQQMQRIFLYILSLGEVVGGLERAFCIE